MEQKKAIPVSLVCLGVAAVLLLAFAVYMIAAPARRRGRRADAPDALRGAENHANVRNRIRHGQRARTVRL